jgi:hypothetical protein
MGPQIHLAQQYYDESEISSQLTVRGEHIPDVCFAVISLFIDGVVEAGGVVAPWYFALRPKGMACGRA